VADGLGSAVHSNVGSMVAATIATEYCKKQITPQPEASNILDNIRAAFTAALFAVEKTANEKDHAIELYDTTLTLVVLIRDTLYYGHSGDSGIIALTTQGRYEAVTIQQRDDQGRVFPLFFSDKWEFELYSEKVSGVLLATDGMLETFFPIYIRNEPVSIHVSLAQFFLDNRNLRIKKVGQKAVQARISEFMENIPDEQVNDDKTVAVLINTSVKTKRQPKEYYQEPDWAELKQKHEDEWRREAYPGLYKELKTDIEVENGIENESDSKQALQVAKRHSVIPLIKQFSMLEFRKLRLFLLLVVVVSVLATIVIFGYLFIVKPLIEVIMGII
jgi:hypothetical protein